jgi:hypothetical protein
VADFHDHDCGSDWHSGSGHHDSGNHHSCSSGESHHYGHDWYDTHNTEVNHRTDSQYSSTYYGSNSNSNYSYINSNSTTAKIFYPHTIVELKKSTQENEADYYSCKLLIKHFRPNIRNNQWPWHFTYLGIHPSKNNDPEVLNSKIFLLQDRKELFFNIKYIFESHRWTNFIKTSIKFPKNSPVIFYDNMYCIPDEIPLPMHAYNNRYYIDAAYYFRILFKQSSKEDVRNFSQLYLCKIALRQGDLKVAKEYAKNSEELYQQLLEQISDAQKTSTNPSVQWEAVAQARIILDQVSTEKDIVTLDTQNLLEKARKDLNGLERSLVLKVGENQKEFFLKRSRDKWFTIGNKRKSDRINLAIEEINRTKGETFTPLLQALRSKRTNLSKAEATSYYIIPKARRMP